MKLQTYQETHAPAASAVSVSLNDNKDLTVKGVQNPLQKEEELWQEITDELASNSSPIWRMWR